MSERARQLKRVESVRALRERIAEATALRAMAEAARHTRAVHGAEVAAQTSLAMYRDALAGEDGSACHIAEFAMDVAGWRKRLLMIHAGIAQTALNAARGSYTKARVQTQQAATLLRAAHVEAELIESRREQTTSDERFLARQNAAGLRNV